MDITQHIQALRNSQTIIFIRLSPNSDVTAITVIGAG